MRPSTIKSKLSRGEPALLTQLHFTDPSVYELASLMGFDGIWMDMEHHTYSLETATALMRAARVGHSDIMARAAKGEFARVARLLEAGAQGIMYPRCDTADEAREVIKWAKFSPLGRRGFDGGNPDMPYCNEVHARVRHSRPTKTPSSSSRYEDARGPGPCEAIAAVPARMRTFSAPPISPCSAASPSSTTIPACERRLERVAKAALTRASTGVLRRSRPDHMPHAGGNGGAPHLHSADILLVNNGL